MPNVQRTPSRASDDGVRKRVGKACDRCRLKKSKCDGLAFCSRCKADNAPCEFGARKRSQDRVFPKGFTEMLERQQIAMVAGFQEIVRQAQAGTPWTGKDLPLAANGLPLLHDILTDLKVLGRKNGADDEEFEEDPQKMHDQLFAAGGPSCIEAVQRRGSICSDSDRSSHHDYVRTPSDARATPFETKPNPDELNFGPPSSSQSPAASIQAPMFPHCEPNPMVSQHDPQLYQAPWSFIESNPSNMLRSNSYPSQLDNSIYSPMHGVETFGSFVRAGSDGDMSSSFQPQQTSAHFPGPVLYHDASGFYDQAEFDYNNYVADMNQ